jgi:CelD/BcsL family acetyltransferase involved in cellulose biosynthesis
MLEKTWEILGRSGTFIWPYLPIGSAALPVMREVIKRNNLLSVETKRVCPQLIFEKDYSSMEKLWKRNHRTNVRRNRKRLAKQGQVRLWTASTKEEIRQLLPEFFQVHDDIWHSRSLPGKFHDPLMRKYYYHMVECLWDKGLHFSTLMCSGDHISYHFGFLSGGWLLYYKPTYRIQYQNFSPGKVHVSYLIEEGIKAGWKGLDFLQGNEPYKLQWSNEKMQTVSFVIGLRRLSPSYFWFSYGNPLAKKRFGTLYFKLKAAKEIYLR